MEAPSLRTALSPVPPLLVALAWGCTGSAPDARGAEGSAAAEYVVGDTLVKEVGAPLHPGIATLVPELTIGMESGPEEYLFGGPSEILYRRDGSIVVLDWSGGGLGGAIVRAYDADGHFLRTIGARGRGPGEYSSPTGLVELPDGRIAFTDNFNARISVYTPAGEPLTSWPIRGHPITIRGAEILRVDPQGTLSMRFRIGAMQGRDRTMGILRLRPDGTVIDTIFPPALPDVTLPTVTARRDRGACTYEVPYSPRARWSLSPLGYFVTGVPTRYAIDLRLPPGPASNGPGGGDPSAARGGGAVGRADAPRAWAPGDRVTSLRRPVPPVDVSPAERSAQREHTEGLLRQCGTPDGPLPEVPATKPHFQFIATMDDGRIWVLIHAPSEQFDPPEIPGREQQLGWREKIRYDVFEPDGVYVGQVEMPDGVYPESARGDVVWGVTRGELDVPKVVRFRIQWGA